MIFQKFHITIISLWLSLQLIVGSVGLPIFEHYCQMSGKTDTSLIEKECCCEISATNLAKLTEELSPENHCVVEVESTKDTCCDTQTSYEKANFEAISIEKTVFKFNHFVTLLPSQIYFKNFTEKSFFTAFQITHFADLPPPNWKIGKRFIVFIQVFRL